MIKPFYKVYFTTPYFCSWDKLRYSEVLQSSIPIRDRNRELNFTGQRSACHSAESVMFMNIIAWGPQIN